MSRRRWLMAMERNVSDDAQGPDGLPDTSGNVRWTASRKMAVLRAVRSGEISAEEIARRYAITPEELDTWSRDYAERGLFGLQEKGWMARRRRPPFSGGGDPQGRGTRPSAPASRRPLDPAGDSRRRALHRVAGQVSISSGDNRRGMSEYLTDDRKALPARRSNAGPWWHWPAPWRNGARLPAPGAPLTPAVPILRRPFAAYRVGSGSLTPKPAILLPA